jgi:hypothetical protein
MIGLVYFLNLKESYLYSNNLPSDTNNEEIAHILLVESVAVVLRRRFPKLFSRGRLPFAI